MKLTRAHVMALFGVTLAIATATAGGVAMKREMGGVGSPAGGPTARTVVTPPSPATGGRHAVPSKAHDTAAPVEGIVGGSQSYTTLPYIGIFAETTTGAACGVTLIADNAILSAAHCFPTDETVDGWSVRIGSTDRLGGGTVAALTGKPVRVGDADMAVAWLRDPVSIQPAILSSETPAPGQPVLNVGWGNECINNNPDGVPLPLPAIPRDAEGSSAPPPIILCPAPQELPRYLKELHSTTIECPDPSSSTGYTCNRADTPGGSTAPGDSGSPLLTFGSDGVWRVAGTLTGGSGPSVSIYGSTGYWKPLIKTILGHSLP